MLPSVIAGPGGCFALTMPGAYRPAMARAIFNGEHPKRRGERVGRPRLNRAARRCDGASGCAPLPRWPPLAKVQHQRRVELGVAQRAVLRGASERPGTLAASDFNGPDY